MNRIEAEQLLKAPLASPLASFREGQWEAIDALVNERKKSCCSKNRLGQKFSLLHRNQNFSRSKTRAYYYRITSIGVDEEPD